MWTSWRPRRSIALVESKDRIARGEPVIVLGPTDKTDREADVNRPVAIKHGGLYRKWYTGQERGKSWIGYATSEDGKTWRRESERPVLSATKPWEKVAVMCPHVLFNEGSGAYRMWYSGGEQYEPDAIGCATSKDGLTWENSPGGPGPGDGRGHVPQPSGIARSAARGVDEPIKVGAIGPEEASIPCGSHPSPCTLTLARLICDNGLYWLIGRPESRSFGRPHAFSRRYVPA
jgi:hypothetical protein